MLNPFSAKAGRDVSSACASHHPTAGSWGGHTGLLWGSTLGVSPRTLYLATSSLATARDGEGGLGVSWDTHAIDFLLDLSLYPSQGSQRCHSFHSLPWGCLPEHSCHENRQGLTDQGQLLAPGTQPWHCWSQWQLQCPAWNSGPAQLRDCRDVPVAPALRQ